MKPIHHQDWQAYGRRVHFGDGTSVELSTPELAAELLISAHARARAIAALPRLVKALAVRLRYEAAPCVCHSTAPERCNNCIDRGLLREIGVVP